jgi:hypothetical protein
MYNFPTCKFPPNNLLTVFFSIKFGVKIMYCLPVDEFSLNLV